MKTIHRTRLREKFTPLPNALLQDRSLSFRARGVLAMMLSLPEDWQTHQCWIESQGKEGREAIRAAIKELEAKNFLRRHKLREAGRLVATVWQWYDSPQDGSSPPDGKPSCGPPAATKNTEKQKARAEESEETPLRSEEDVVVKPVWKPEPGDKNEKLARLPNAVDFPDETEFNAFLVAEDLTRVIEYRPHLYLELCERKWRHWIALPQKWQPIRDWKAYVRSLNGKIESAFDWTVR